MNNKIIITIILISILLITGCNKDAKTYEIGEIINVKLNDNLNKDFYVIEDLGKTLKLLAKDSIGESIFNNIQEGYGCQFYGDCKSYNKFEESIIESKLKELTKDWKNILEITLLDIEDLIKILNIENKHFYKRSNESLKIQNYKEILNGNYWLLNTYTKSISLAWQISDGTISTNSIENVNQIKPVILILK